jgi:hypothetical protein
MATSSHPITLKNIILSSSKRVSEKLLCTILLENLNFILHLWSYQVFDHILVNCPRYCSLRKEKGVSIFAAFQEGHIRNFTNANSNRLVIFCVVSFSCVSCKRKLAPLNNEHIRILASIVVCFDVRLIKIINTEAYVC